MILIFDFKGQLVKISRSEFEASSDCEMRIAVAISCIFLVCSFECLWICHWVFWWTLGANNIPVGMKVVHTSYVVLIFLRFKVIQFKLARLGKRAILVFCLTRKIVGFNSVYSWIRKTQRKWAGPESDHGCIIVFY